MTGDVFLSDSAHHGALRSALGRDCHRHGGAAVVQVCGQFGVPCPVLLQHTS